MQRAFSTLGCEEFSWDEVVALAKRHGLHAVEIRALGGTIDLPGYFAKRFGQPAQLAAAVAESGVAVVGIDTSCRLISADEEGRAELVALGPWAEALGGPALRVFDGGETLDEASLAMAAARWSWWQEVRRERGWAAQLMVETHDTLITAAAVARFQDAMPSRVPVLWDAFHTWSKGSEDPVQTWAGIRDDVCHVHVKDGRPGGTEGRAFTHTLPGEGAFPMAGLREVLAAGGFEGPVSLEWGRKWHPYLPSLDEALSVATRLNWW